MPCYLIRRFFLDANMLALWMFYLLFFKDEKVLPHHQVFSKINLKKISFGSSEMFL